MTLDISPQIAATSSGAIQGSTELKTNRLLQRHTVLFITQVTILQPGTQESSSTESHVHVYQSTWCHQNTNSFSETILCLRQKIVVSPQNTS
jgi:hypothetical protein